jgi:hypothetical protein
MTILAVFEQLCPVIGLAVPTTVYGSTDREHVELQALANEMAVRIAKAHDWTLLRTLKTYTGDATTTQHALPTDYMRMLKKAQVWSSELTTPLTHIVDTDYWLELDVRGISLGVNRWTILGGNMEIKPALDTAVTAKWYYISNLIVDPATGDNKALFTIDTDTFRLNERTLRLGCLWQWRANKGLPYGEDMANYEDALAQDIAQDQGSRLIRIGRVRMPTDARVAFHGNITP